jgi:IS5 family transposase
VRGQKPGRPGQAGPQTLDSCGCLWHPPWVITAPANRHGSPLLDDTLDALEALGGLPDQVSVHLDRGYDSDITRQKLDGRGLIPMIAEKGKPAPLQATKRWVIERTNSWHNAHKKLLWCTETRRRLIREAWTRYRWETRPSRRP